MHILSIKKFTISKYDLIFFLILSTFVVFATTYSIITPTFEAPDETFQGAPSRDSLG